MVTIIYLCWNDAHNRYTDNKELHEGVSKGRAVVAGLASGSRSRSLGIAQYIESTISKCIYLSQKRVVFNIHGNHYRLIVDIEYRLKIVFIVWFGPHSEYDQIDARRISYDRAHQK